MVVRLSGREQLGPQLGPDPVWARFSVEQASKDKSSRRVRVQARKPDVTDYRILGNDPYAMFDAEERVRNRYNSSVYVAGMDSVRGRAGACTVRVPVVGEIAAGQYDVTVAYQEYDCLDYEGGVAVDKALARNGAYALRVRGTSMTHVGIEPGDVVIVKPQNYAEDGDFVVAAYQGDAAGAEGLATLKRFYRRRDHIHLQSATAATSPIMLYADRREGASDPDPVRIQGVVTMVLKPGRE